jgi:hypothetical protein
MDYYCLHSPRMACPEWPPSGVVKSTRNHRPRGILEQIKPLFGQGAARFEGFSDVAPPFREH